MPFGDFGYSGGGMPYLKYGIYKYPSWNRFSLFSIRNTDLFSYNNIIVFVQNESPQTNTTGDLSAADLAELKDAQAQSQMIFPKTLVFRVLNTTIMKKKFNTNFPKIPKKKSIMAWKLLGICLVILCIPPKMYH